MRPVIICMITDGRCTGGRDVNATVERVAAAARAGVHLVQVRERHLEGGALLDLVSRCVARVRGTTARIVVNDRLDVALAAGAHGAHLRSDSFSAARARPTAPPGFLLGRSIHDAGAAQVAASSADYLIFGTVFQTTSKPGRAAAGLPALADVVRATTLPVLAVGGVTIENIPDVARAGAAGIAAIGLFADTPVDGLPAIVQRAARAFA